jgi:hypothetical protein
MIKYIFLVLILFGLVLAYLEYVVWTQTNLHRNKNPKCYSGNDFKYTNVSREDMQLITEGRQRAKNSQIVIVGLAKDIRERLEQNIPRACHIGQQFSDYRVLVLENDSTDGTREYLSSYSKKNPRVERVPCCSLGDCACILGNKSASMTGALSKSRIDKMASYRNQALSYIKDNYPQYDYMLVLDLDTEGPCPTEGIFHSLGHDGWDMIASNGKAPVPSTMGHGTMTYDALAYVRKDTIHQGPQKPVYKMFTDAADLNFRHYGNGMVQVDSAFNGAALYKMRSVEGCSYANYMNCEHIGLHKQMIDSGKDKIYLNLFWVWYVGFQGPRDLIKLIKS